MYKYTYNVTYYLLKEEEEEGQIPSATIVTVGKVSRGAKIGYKTLGLHLLLYFTGFKSFVRRGKTRGKRFRKRDFLKTKLEHEIYNVYINISMCRKFVAIVLSVLLYSLPTKM